MDKTAYGREEEPGIFQMASWKQITAWVAIVLVAYQAIMMLVWITWPQYDWYFLRISLSFADALTLCALVISVYADKKTTEMGASQDFAYFSRFVMALRKEGVDPDKAGATIGRFLSVGERLMPRLERIAQMTDDELDRALDNATGTKPLKKKAPLDKTISEPPTEGKGQVS